MDKLELWRAMRREARAMLKHEAPLEWRVISDRLYGKFGYEPDEDMVMLPDVDNGLMRRDEYRYYELREDV